MSDIEFVLAAFDSAEALELIEAVQEEYVQRYGTRDLSSLEAVQFAPPDGLFVIGRLDDSPVACGGVRLVEPGLGELKRMYVAPAVRRRGIARMLLSHLEGQARELGATRLRLETGLHQPEALALYASAGYAAVEPFGYYANHELARHFGKSLMVADSVE